MTRARATIEAGVTLVELMIVVAIIGILAAGATYMYSKSQAKAKEKEVNLMFAEFKLKQEQYYLQNDTYLSTGANENSKWPTSPAGTKKPNNIAPLPAAWNTLRLSPDKSALYCSYVAISGPANGGTIGPIANQFGLTAPPSVDWYYLVAECNWDNSRSSLNSLYFTTNQTDEIFQQNKGR